MQGKILDIVAGAIIGFICGVIFYVVPAKCLMTGTMPASGLFLPEGVNSAVLAASIKWGGSIGAIIGFLGGLSMPFNLPRNHMSRSISCVSFLVCTIAAFIMHGGQLAHMTSGRIAITFLWVFASFFLAVPLGAMLGFIEKIRE